MTSRRGHGLRPLVDHQPGQRRRRLERPRQVRDERELAAQAACRWQPDPALTGDERQLRDLQLQRGRAVQRGGVHQQRVQPRRAGAHAGRALQPRQRLQRVAALQLVRAPERVVELGQVRGPQQRQHLERLAEHGSQPVRIGVAAALAAAQPPVGLGQRRLPTSASATARARDRLGEAEEGEVDEPRAHVAWPSPGAVRARLQRRDRAAAVGTGAELGEIGAVGGRAGLHQVGVVERPRGQDRLAERPRELEVLAEAQPRGGQVAGALAASAAASRRPGSSPAPPRHSAVSSSCSSWDFAPGLRRRAEVERVESGTGRARRAAGGRAAAAPCRSRRGTRRGSRRAAGRRAAGAATARAPARPRRAGSRPRPARAALENTTSSRWVTAAPGRGVATNSSSGGWISPCASASTLAAARLTLPRTAW